MRSVLVVLGILLSASSAWAQSAQTLWSDATARMAQDQEEEALILLETLVREYPKDALSDDALFLAGTLLEEKLGRPVHAKAAYQKLLGDYPQSRAALAAERRLRSLEESLGADMSGAAALAAYQDLLHRFPERGTEKSLVLADALLKAHSSWSGSYRIHLWIAETNRRLGYLDRAGTHFEAVRASDAPREARLQASLGAIDLEILGGHFAMASQRLEELESDPNATVSEKQAVAELRQRALLTAARKQWLVASYLLLASMLLFLLVVARRVAKSRKDFLYRLRTPPLEVIYMVPVALLLTGMAFTGHQEIGPAVALISGGGLLVSWFAANAFGGANPLRWPRALCCTIAATLAALSLCYLALHQGQLLGLLETTLAFGPE